MDLSVDPSLLTSPTADVELDRLDMRELWAMIDVQQFVLRKRDTAVEDTSKFDNEKDEKQLYIFPEDEDAEQVQ